ncbi:hypothetical protein D9619_013622 [Psilocybe cf. subviscida]|uniref:Phytocyanin domain-containing protein n=1 Tax=Psilocybe cf. subviscida TaxID=2480587 RepID=A0A8H5BR91_9AGAR|nr:hypothetical protein D9619_013622 [Psilocybe cf. subviscida]
MILTCVKPSRVFHPHSFPCFYSTTLSFPLMIFAAILSAIGLVTGIAAQTQIIQVSGQSTTPGGIFQFTPPQIPKVPFEGVVMFEFTGAPGNHSVTQSSFADPCNPLAGGFDSGSAPVYSLLITNNTIPIWFYCKQLVTSPHCVAGMVGAINAPATGNTFAQFQKNAEAVGGIPAQSEGALGGTSALTAAGIGGTPTTFPMTANGSGGLVTGGQSNSPSAMPARTSMTITGGSSSEAPVTTLSTNGGSSLEATVTALPATPSSVTTNNNEQTATARRSSTKSVSTGAIAGSITGGFIVIVLSIFLFWFRKRNMELVSGPTNNNMTSLLSSAGSHAFDPYTMPPTTTATGTEPLPSKERLKFSAIETTLPLTAVPVEKVTVTEERSRDFQRVQRLRLERERINRELASLDQISEPGSNHSDGSADGGHSTISLRTNQRLLAEQLATLQMQLVQVEERQQHMQAGLPSYVDIAPNSGHPGKKFLAVPM